MELIAKTKLPSTLEKTCSSRISKESRRYAGLATDLFTIWSAERRLLPRIEVGGAEGPKIFTFV